MGTLGYGCYKKLTLTKNTTESPENIYKFIQNMLYKNIDTIAMEISSHGISQNRILGLPFNIAILTNITSEHLDYHQTIQQYIHAKLSFLLQYNINTFIINIDDPIARSCIKKLSNKNIISVTINNHYSSFLSKKWINVNKIEEKHDYTTISFNSTWGSGILSSKLIGLFNVTNLLLALASLLELKYPIQDLIKVCNKIKTISGRMQYFKFPNKPKIIIDYAHNKDALKNLLNTIKMKFKNKKIWCIFGCGGNRDKNKRPHMGKIAEILSDKIILTNDNPRNENPLDIIQDILSGCKNKNKIHVILNREKAIKFALNNANIQDIIIISGKGHEKYQIINNKYYYYSDQDVINKLLK